MPVLPSRQVGTTWGNNKHNRTIREAEPSEPATRGAERQSGHEAQIADHVQLVMGDTRANRFLKRSASIRQARSVVGNGDVLPARGRAKFEHVENPTWNAEIFAAQCAGCHATAIDPETHAFVTLSLDCYTCHGDAPAEHANDPKLMPLAKKRHDSAGRVTSICAQCHVRFGKSKSTGLAYPNNFVAGDNLFRILPSTSPWPTTRSVNPADRHVVDNVRDVVLYGRDSRDLPHLP